MKGYQIKIKISNYHNLRRLKLHGQITPNAPNLDHAKK